MQRTDVLPAIVTIMPPWLGTDSGWTAVIVGVHATAPLDTHAAADEAPVPAVTVPAGHPVHVVEETAPITVLYVSRGHAVQLSGERAANAGL